MTKMFPGQEHVCSRVDKAECESPYVYPAEFLHTLCLSGMLSHRITLKLGMVIRLLRNFDQHNGQCNGSRTLIDRILPSLLVAKSVVGVNAGHALLIPDITLSPSDNIFPLCHFPVTLCFAITLHKRLLQPWSVGDQQDWQIKQASHCLLKMMKQIRSTAFPAVWFMKRC